MSPDEHSSGRPPAVDLTGQEYTVLAAQVRGAHGINGGVRLRLIGSPAETAIRSLAPGQVVRATPAPDDPGRALTLSSLRKQPQPKGSWLARFKEVESRTDAEEIAGYSLWIRESERAPLEPGEYYVDQLLGLEIVTDTGRSLGRMTDVLQGPAHDVYVTDAGALIPAVGAFVLEIVLGGRILVRDMPGLHDEP